jgi:hypothetical protein
MTLELRIDGPYSDEYTVEVVWGIAEAVRVVNHAAMSPSGLTRPQTVNAAATALGLAAMRLEATLKRLTTFLIDQQEAGRLAAAGAGSTAGAVANTAASLDQARSVAGQLKLALYGAASATNDLVVASPATGAEVKRS